jgi:ATP-dependent RNA helicase RhlE
MPNDVRRLVQEILHDPVTIQIGRTIPATTVSHALYPVKQHLKTALLKELLSKTKTESVLIFTRTKHRAERVAQQLAKAGHRVASLQGDMPSTDAYIHRIGRTGRVGKAGEAFTLVTGEDTAIVRSLERLLNRPLEHRTLKGFDYTRCAPAREYIRPLRQLGRRAV